METSSKKAPPTPQFVLRGSEAPVYALCWAPQDGSSLVSGSGDGSVMLWDYAKKRCRVRLKVSGCIVVVLIIVVLLTVLI
jgi:WD40 repeat protein